MAASEDFEARWSEATAGLRSDKDGRVHYSQFQQGHDDDDERNDRR